MNKGKLWFIFCCFIISAFGLCSCVSNALRYSASDIAKADFGAKLQRIAVVDLIDASTMNISPDLDEKYKLLAYKNWESQVTSLRISVREHLLQAGFVNSTEEVINAPTSIEQIKTILRTAKQQGASSVMFLRINNKLTYTNLHMAWHETGVFLTLAGILPGLIMNSIPKHEECAAFVLEAVLVDPKTSQLLQRVVVNESNYDKVSNFGYDSKFEFYSDVFKNAVKKVVVSVVKSSREGYPDKAKRLDLSSILKPAPLMQFNNPNCGTFLY